MDEVVRWVPRPPPPQPGGAPIPVLGEDDVGGSGTPRASVGRVGPLPGLPSVSEGVVPPPTVRIPLWLVRPEVSSVGVIASTWDEVSHVGILVLSVPRGSFANRPDRLPSHVGAEVANLVIRRDTDHTILILPPA